MRDEKSEKRASELDDFWDIDALIPRRHAPHYAHDTEATEIVIDAPDSQNTPPRESIPPKKEEAPKPRFIPPHNPENVREIPPDEEYFPENSLLRMVRLYRENSTYRYYEDFVRSAERLLEVHGVECSHVPFFSYVPQYSQMTRAQLEWYLWWRECQRNGKTLTTDYSYILLYAYEIINLGGRMNTVEGRDALARLWTEYRELFHQLDSYLPNWICDYCLIHRVQPPRLEPKMLFAAMSRCTLKEFYLTATGRDGLVRALPWVCSDYDYRKSKFYTEENKPLYEKHIHGALLAVFSNPPAAGRVPSLESGGISHMVRPSYNGALCAHSTKCKIVLEYTSFYTSYELRQFVTDVIKYTENRLRAHLGIRSRLSVTVLSPNVRAMVDAHLAPFLPRYQQENTPQTQEREAYEKLYDLPATPLSLERAKQIEQASWGTTERLIEAFAEEGDTSADASLTKEATLPPMSECTVEKQIGSVISEAPVSDTEVDIWQPYAAFLLAALLGDAAKQKSAAHLLGKMPDVLADEINTIAVERLGDILLEENDSGYGVIEDYRAEAVALLEMRKEE